MGPTSLASSTPSTFSLPLPGASTTTCSPSFSASGRLPLSLSHSLSLSLSLSFSSHSPSLLLLSPSPSPSLSLPPPSPHSLALAPLGGWPCLSLDLHRSTSRSPTHTPTLTHAQSRAHTRAQAHLVSAAGRDAQSHATDERPSVRCGTTRQGHAEEETQDMGKKHATESKEGERGRERHAEDTRKTHGQNGREKNAAPAIPPHKTAAKGRRETREVFVWDGAWLYGTAPGCVARCVARGSGAGWVGRRVGRLCGTASKSRRERQARG